ncbi:hypothetical protein EDF54_0407 [Rathayibacter sp. PhB93]|uniref:hypothetical protein n=1 Tax=unclassified Rathayibacter TaxID=2609250 RepID=UPI000F92559C|nr:MULTISPECIES: hypothetical protein [unclassified Rathayibacter]ROQ15544.1 hypothetical protein EDF54_0407 [Rathayibacter sp. PhB93]TDQ15482.1 hypothetical protein EDF17_0152 [Rathayibacter sp. PhB1]
MSPSSTPTPGPSRRTVSAAAVWSAPVAAAVIAAPLAAASTAVLCESAVAFRRTSNTGGDTAVLLAPAPSGAVSTVRITSVLAPGTTTTTQGQSYNLSQSGFGWQGRVGSTALESREERFSGSAPRGALGLNQRREGPITTLPSPGSDSQTLTFQFLDPQGQVFDPVDLQLEFFDFTSLSRQAWVPTHWDAMGFSVAPTAIVQDGLYAGTGAGTLADPYRREGDNLPTVDVFKKDVFSFASFPSGSTLTYTQHDGRQGWHSVFLTGLSFRSAVC